MTRFAFSVCLSLFAVTGVSGRLYANALSLPEAICSERGVTSDTVIGQLRQQGWKDANGDVLFRAMISDMWPSLLDTFFWKHGPKDAQDQLSTLKKYRGRERELYEVLYKSAPAVIQESSSGTIVIAGRTKTDIKHSYFFDYCFELYTANDEVAAFAAAAVSDKQFGATATPASLTYVMLFDTQAPGQRTKLIFVDLLSEAYKDFGDDAPRYPVQVRRITEYIVPREGEP